MDLAAMAPLVAAVAADTMAAVVADLMVLGYNQGQVGLIM